jgi:hypothetical protein
MPRGGLLLCIMLEISFKLLVSLGLWDVAIRLVRGLSNQRGTGGAASLSRAFCFCCASELYQDSSESIRPFAAPLCNGCLHMSTKHAALLRWQWP